MKRLYRILLRIYPAGFREEYAPELERQFSDEYREAEGRRERLRLGLRVLADLAATAPAEIARELWQDLRYAARIYRRRSLVTTLALTALALAIGATAGVFSVVNALLLRSLPFRDPERLVELANFSSIEFDLHRRPAFYEWQDQSTWWQDVTAYRSPDMNLSRTGQAIRVKVTETTSGFFTTLGSEPQFGRPFAADEDVAGKDAVVVISYGVWRQLFGGDPSALGATVRLNGVPSTVIGVAPPGFDYPEKTAVWTPTYFDSGRLPKSDGFFGHAVGRLKPGLALAQASIMFGAALSHTYPREITKAPQDRLHLAPLQQQLAGPVLQASLVLLAVVVFVLLIACANVAQLLLSRITERRQELAIRTALGASRARLTQQFITESIALTMAAATAGLAVAHWASRLAASALPTALSTQQYTIVDWRVLGFTVAVAMLTGALFGVLPAFLIGRIEVTADSVRGQTANGPGVARMRAALVCMQTAFTVVLMAGSFTMGRSFLKLVGTDLGFHTNNVVTLSVSFFGSRYEIDQRAAQQYYQEALDRLRRVPGVESAGAADYLPLLPLQSVPIEKAKLDSGQTLRPVPVSVTPGYFRSIGAALVAGRDFTDADRAGSEPVAIVNEQFVRTANAASTLIGTRVSLLTLSDLTHPTIIVGVVRTTRFTPTTTLPQIYYTAAQAPPAFATLVARVRGNPQRYLAVLRDALQQVDRQVPVYDVKTFDQRLQDILAKPRFYTTAILFFGSFALLLAVIGTYGVATHSVAQRTHEIGVRIAVGASPRGLRCTLLRQSMLPVAVGMLIGVAGAAGLGRLLQHLVPSAESAGLWMCATAASVLAATTAAAVWTATGRIVRMDPTAALKVE
jgi:predicted permease